MNNQQRVNRRHCNLPAELMVEIVDFLPLENAVHFLANVPTRLIIHHCAPRIRRVRRMLKMIDQIATDYVRILPAPNPRGRILFENGHQYTPEMEIFLRYGAEHCRDLWIWRGTSDAFVGYPVDFFNDLIMYYYETKVPTKAIPSLIIGLPAENPAPWPAALVQPQAGKMNVEEVEVHNYAKCVVYTLRNKHNLEIAFKLYIFFQEDAQCYQKMTGFSMEVQYIYFFEYPIS